MRDSYGVGEQYYERFRAASMAHNTMIPKQFEGFAVYACLMLI
nr:hypothetical protein [uncultured Blautia sp.]